MSTFLEQTRARVPRLADAVSQRRARLRVVGAAEQRAPRLPFATLVLTVLGLGLVGLLVLNTSLQHQAFYARSLGQKAEALTMRKQELVMEVDALRAPDRVARQAQTLGMLPNDSPAFLFLSDGKVRGDAGPADPALALRLDPVRPRRTQADLRADRRDPRAQIRHTSRTESAPDGTGGINGSNATRADSTRQHRDD